MKRGAISGGLLLHLPEGNRSSPIECSNTSLRAWPRRRRSCAAKDPDQPQRHGWVPPIRTYPTTQKNQCDFSDGGSRLSSGSSRIIIASSRLSRRQWRPKPIRLRWLFFPSSPDRRGVSVRDLVPYAPVLERLQTVTDFTSVEDTDRYFYDPSGILLVDSIHLRRAHLQPGRLLDLLPSSRFAQR